MIAKRNPDASSGASGSVIRPATTLPSGRRRRIIHHVEKVSQLLLLRTQVSDVVLGCDGLQRDTFDDGQAVPLETRSLRGVVRQQTHGSHAEVDEDLRADAVVAWVGR